MPDQLTRGLELSRRWRRIIGAVIAIMFLAIPLTTSSRLWAPEISSTLGWISLPWFALIGLTFVNLVVVDLFPLAWYSFFCAEPVRRVVRAARAILGVIGEAGG